MSQTGWQARVLCRMLVNSQDAENGGYCDFAGNKIIELVLNQTEHETKSVKLFSNKMKNQIEEQYVCD